MTRGNHPEIEAIGAGQADAARPVMLPKLAYWGDVPVESSYHGSALLYRLLEGYPHERLAILECGQVSSLPERRLQGIPYQHFPPPHLLSRLQRSRWHPWASIIQTVAQRQFGRRGGLWLSNYQPDAIITVAHDFAWLAAACYASQSRIPLHLIVHDDWPSVISVPPGLRRVAQQCFGNVYRQAASRLCVSPAMEHEYRRRYARPGQVLYPSRSLTCVDHAPLSRPCDFRRRPFTVAFAGTLSTVDYAVTLAAVAVALEELQGDLLVYGPLDIKQAKGLGLTQRNIKIMGLLPGPEVIRRMREQADLLLLPMSFHPAEETAMRLNFPSKLTDYTASGLPILIIGPKSSSAVQWAESYPGVAHILTNRRHSTLAEGLLKLAQEHSYRLELGTMAKKIGTELFSPQVAQHTLHSRLADAAAESFCKGSAPKSESHDHGAP